MPGFLFPKSWLKVEADKEYGLETIKERIELDYDLPPTHPSFAKAIKERVLKAVEKYERVHHWHWRSDIPVEIDVSTAQFDVHKFRGNFRDEDMALDQGSLLLVHGRKAYVAKITFQTQKIQYNSDRYVATSSDGFVKPEQVHTNVKNKDLE